MKVSLSVMVVATDALLDLSMPSVALPYYITSFSRCGGGPPLNGGHAKASRRTAPHELL